VFWNVWHFWLCSAIEKVVRKRWVKLYRQNFWQKKSLIKCFIQGLISWKLLCYQFSYEMYQVTCLIECSCLVSCWNKSLYTIFYLFRFMEVCTNPYFCINLTQTCIHPFSFTTIDMKLKQRSFKLVVIKICKAIVAQPV